MTTYNELQQQIAALQKHAEEVKKAEKDAMIPEIREKIRLYGLTPDDLGFGAKGDGRKATSAVPVQYRDTHGRTWTGRGKRPTWLTQELANGRDIEDFRVRA